ncbi:MAG: hypothetical protein IK123_10490, partial [Lachnospiraceae bacterium]|nr:hypothetical protein [Lachnospiraceae bacterium]
MFLLLLVLVSAVAGCVIFEKKIHEIIPTAVLIVTLAVYVFALVLPLTVAVWISTGLVAVALFAAIIIRRKKRDSEGLLRMIITQQMGILLIVCVIFCILMVSHRTFFYDDLSYWGIYTKSIFYIDKLPHLFENCSVNYKDYPPIIQILQYISMFGRDRFSEPAMFQTNICLIYILLLPVIRGIGDKARTAGVKVLTVILYVIFPHILTSQFYYRLGVDLFLALVFGYALLYIFDLDSIIAGREDTARGKYDDVFRLICIITALSFLALIKSSGIVLCLFAIIIFAV